ncbi:aldo/keto reductase [Streptomyces phaeochromogenes]
MHRGCSQQTTTKGATHVRTGQHAERRLDRPRPSRLPGRAALAATSLMAVTGAAAAPAHAVRPATGTGAPARHRSQVTAAITQSGHRRLGRLKVSSIGLGTQTMPGNLYSSVASRKDMVTLIRTAVDQGVTFFDTAEAYGPFESERIVGDASGPVRHDVVTASKFGWDINPDTGARNGLNSRPHHIRRAVDGMLRRLRTNHIDLLYQHRVDPTVPIEDVADAVRDSAQPRESCRLPGRGRPTTTTKRVSASMTTWCAVE